MMEAVQTSETSVNSNQSTRRYNPAALGHYFLLDEKKEIVPPFRPAASKHFLKCENLELATKSCRAPFELL
jgi:hypothetical protein